MKSRFKKKRFKGGLISKRFFSLKSHFIKTMVEDSMDLANFSEEKTKVETVPRLSHLYYIMLLCKNRQQGDKKF